MGTVVVELGLGLALSQQLMNHVYAYNPEHYQTILIQFVYITTGIWKWHYICLLCHD